MAKWMPLEELERLLAVVDVFEPLPPWSAWGWGRR
jgi:hypothetical protein